MSLEITNLRIQWRTIIRVYECVYLKHPYLSYLYNFYFVIVEMMLTITACQILVLSTYFIQGRNLLAGAKKEEYFVQIGLDGKCLVKEMTDENITCLPPNEVPGTSHSDENVAAIMVQIILGFNSNKNSSFSNLNYLGKLGCYFVISIFIEIN